MERSFFSYAWRHSRSEQWIALALVAVSLPFYWVSLDIPRLIVNDAIQGRAFPAGVTAIRGFEINLTLPGFLGGSKFTLSDGFLVTQMQYLVALSLMFLTLTLINGGFKYVINVRRGILGERMLRRLRFELFERVMRFRPEDLRATKSAEISSMIKDEVEPIGGFFGEAFITPAFLMLQALTALIFIIVQNIPLGLLTAAIIGVQGIIIPRLRREQLRLARERQVASRRLAGRVAEMVDAAPMLRTFGLVPKHGAEIGTRLGDLFRIRVELFRRKFSVKFLNNLLAQVTPFLFYILGGYLALTGQLDIGQLVAVIAAYRDLPTPVKELIDWDQQRADVTVKFEQVVKAFSRDLLPRPTESDAEFAIPAEIGIEIAGLRHTDRRGTVRLEPLTLSIRTPLHLALVGPPGGGQTILAGILGRQITEYSGSLTLEGRALASLTDEVLSRFAAYLDREPYVMSGSIEENIVLAIQRRPMRAPQEGVTDRRQALELSEALRSGNPPFASTLDWNDYDHLGLAGPQEIEGAIVAALEAIGGYRPIYAAGLSGPMGDLGDPDLSERVLQARAAFRLQLKGGALAGLIESFDAFRYNNTATIAENLLFGHPIGNRFSQEQIGADPFIHAILDAESLTQPLVQIGAKIAENVAAILPSASAGAPALARYPFVPTSDPELLQRIMVDGTSRTGSAARQAARSTLIGFALNYVEPRHRLGLINTDFQLRVLRARQSFRTHLAAQAQNSIAFYDRATLMTLASLRENILFGRLAHGAMASAEAVDGLLDQVIQDHGLTGLVLHLGLKREAGPGGRLLSPDQRTMIALARSVLARPEMLVLDMTLNALPQAEQSETLRRLRRVFTGRSLVATFLHEDDAAGFDRVLVFDGARLVKDRPGKLIEPGERVAAG